MRRPPVRRPRLVGVVAAIVAVIVAAIAAVIVTWPSASSSALRLNRRSVALEAAPSTTAPSTAPLPTTPLPTTAPSPSGVPTAAPVTGPALPQLPDDATSAVFALDPAVRAYVSGRSWHHGCPVPLDDLRLVMVTYNELGQRHRRRTGPLIVHRAVARVVAQTFDRLLATGFEIARVQLVDDYGADDDASTRANNTSAFNCRPAYGATTGFSQHAYGRAIDINPLQNPYVYRDGHVLDPAATPYLDRGTGQPGMIVAGDAVTQAFRRIGWGWGGRWTSIKDYQHFSSNGR